MSVHKVHGTNFTMNIRIISAQLCFVGKDLLQWLWCPSFFIVIRSYNVTFQYNIQVICMECVRHLTVKM